MTGIAEAIQKEAGKQMVEKVLENVNKDMLVDAAEGALQGVLQGNNEKGKDQESSGLVDTVMQKVTDGGIGGIFGAFK